MTLIETMGSVVFTRGPFEIELAAIPIPILSPCFALDKVKKIVAGGEIVPSLMLKSKKIIKSIISINAFFQFYGKSYTIYSFNFSYFIY